MQRFFVETLGSETGPGYSPSEPNRFCSGSEKNFWSESLIVPCGCELVDTLLIGLSWADLALCAGDEAYGLLE